MANSYENTKMPEKPEVKIKPDAIPVDDKGQPLPDPTENLSDYIAPKGVEELKKSYSEIEVDEDVRETMEPPQRANFLRKHKPGKRGYDYYGTPSGSIPNDNNGLKPSPLTELFSAAEALEPEFDVNDIRDHVLSNEPIPGSEFKVVETPKLDRTDIKDDLKDKSDKKELQRTEVKKDPNAPKFLELYKESTNTKVIYQYDEAEMEDAPSKSATDTEEFFAEHSRVAKAKKKNRKKEEKKALKAAIKAEKRRAKERRKAAKKNGKNAVPLTDPKEIMELQPANAHKAENISAEEIAKRAALEAEKKLMAEKKQFISQLKKERLAAEKAAEDARLAREENEKLKAELEKMKEAAEKALLQKQEAEEAFRLARKENKRLDEEIKRQKKEN